MSGPMGEAGAARSFRSRINRVEEARAPFDAEKPDVSILPDWKRELAKKSGWLIAFLIGILAVLVVRLVQFHMHGVALISADPEVTMAIEAGVPLLLSVIVMLMMPYKSALVKLGYLAGIAIAVLCMHNAVHAMPGLFSLMFSPDWTANVIVVTEPNSALFRGESISLIPELQDEKETVKPTILRLN